jgi:hypothetical protein
MVMGLLKQYLRVVARPLRSGILIYSLVKKSVQGSKFKVPS